MITFYLFVSIATALPNTIAFPDLDALTLPVQLSTGADSREPRL
jgi:hypothetical protein